MSNDFKNIEDLFKQAADQSTGTVPPPPDWSAMGSMLKESALIKSGAGAAKVGIGKMIAAKVFTKATIAIVTSATVITGSTLVVTKPWEDEIPQTATDAVEVNTSESETTTQTEAIATEWSLEDISHELLNEEKSSSTLSAPSASDISIEKNEASATMGVSSSTSNSELRKVEIERDKSHDSKTRNEHDLETLNAGLSNGIITVDGITQHANREVSKDEAGLVGSNETASFHISNDSSDNFNTISEVSDYDRASGLNNVQSFKDERALKDARGATEYSHAGHINAGLPSKFETLGLTTSDKFSSRVNLPMMTKLTLSTNLAKKESTIENRDITETEFVQTHQPWFVISPIASIDHGSYNVEPLELNGLSNSIYDIALEDNAIHYTVGVRAGIKVMPFAWLETGFVYAKRSAISGTILLIDESGVGLGLADYQLSGKYYEIPVNIVLRDNSGNLGYFAKVGMHFVGNLSNTANEFKYYDFETELLSTVSPSARTIVPAVNFGGGVEYSFAKHWSAFAEGTYRFAIKPVLNAPQFERAPLNPKWSTLSVGIGVNYYFIRNEK
jgi:hypothetical protein